MLMSAIRIVNKLDVNITLGLEPLGDEIRMNPEALFEIEYQPGFAPVPLVEIRNCRVSGEPLGTSASSSFSQKTKQTKK